YWHNGATGHRRRITFWNWVDEDGKVWGPETYSRQGSGADIYPQGGINTSTHVITLHSAWTGLEFPVGHPVSNGSSDGTYMYVAASGAVVPTVWTEFSGMTETGVHPQDESALGDVSGAHYKLPPGTAGTKIGWIFLYNNIGLPEGGSPLLSTQSVASVSFSDASAAQQLANEAQGTANAK